MQSILNKKIALTLLVLAITFMGLTTYAQAQRVVVAKTTVVKGRTVRTLPKHHVVVTHKSVKYRYADGLFYRPKANGFIIVSAPAGIRVSRLPKRAVAVRVRGRRLYKFDNIYYRKIGRSYEVVSVA